MKRASRISMAALLEDLQLRQQNRASEHADRARSKPRAPTAFADQDNFVHRDGMRFAGTHLVVDLWQAFNLDDAEAIETALPRVLLDFGMDLRACQERC